MFKPTIKQTSDSWNNFTIEAFWSKTECNIKLKFSDEVSFLIIENIPSVTKSLGMENHDSIIKNVAKEMTSKGIVKYSGLLNFIIKTLLPSDCYENLLLKLTIKNLHEVADIYIYHPYVENSIHNNGSIAQVKQHEDGKTYLHYGNNTSLPCFA